MWCFRKSNLKTCLLKLMMIANYSYLINILRGGMWKRGSLSVLFVCLVNYSTVLDFARWRFFLQFWKPRQNDIVELWKCSLKIGGWEIGVVRKLIFCAECNSKNFGLFIAYCTLHKVPLNFYFCVCLNDVRWTFLTFTLLLISFCFSFLFFLK